MTEPEDMELDYDDPVQSMNTPSFHSSFQSSQSFFNKDRLNPNFENSVADLFGNIQLNEEKKQEEKKEQNINSVVPYSSPPSPPRIPSYNSSPAIIQSSHEQQQQQQPNDDTSLQQVDATHSIPQEQGDKPYIVIHSHDYLNHSRGRIHFISGLVKITFMTSIALLALYVTAYFVKSLKYDVSNKIVAYETDSVQDMAYCHQQFEVNECDPKPIPALKDLCKAWQVCMYRPATVSHTKAMAETIADIANGFIETITLRTLLTGIVMTWTFLYFWPSQT